MTTSKSMSDQLHDSQEDESDYVPPPITRSGKRKTRPLLDAQALLEMIQNLDCFNSCNNRED